VCDDDDRRAGARRSDRIIQSRECARRALATGSARDAKLDGCCVVSVRFGGGNKFSGNNSSHTRGVPHDRGCGAFVRSIAAVKQRFGIHEAAGLSRDSREPERDFSVW